MMQLETIIPPDVEPITLEQARAELRLEGDTSRDMEIEAAIRAARVLCEAYLNRAILDQTWELRLDYALGASRAWNPHQQHLPGGPVTEVVAVEYVGTTGVRTPYAPPGWSAVLNQHRPYVRLGAWYSAGATLAITYRVGWLAVEDIPPNIVYAVTVVMRRLFDVYEGDPLDGAPRALLDPHRLSPL